uniref:Alpha-amylase n=1 Tax=Astyanax mexicanus TaxID=7994 RepID=A0A8B9H8K5_ASTMX
IAPVRAECEGSVSRVRISPPSEHIVVSKPHRPWWERYQPISYNLCSRSGTEGELRDMISRCNDVGVKIYADVVINHMCAADAGEGGRSTRGSYFNASREEFPSVPYSAADSNDDKCTSGSGNIENYQDIYQVRNCRLLGLLDLAQEKEHVRGKIVDYLNALVDMGVAGFHVDACKHMWPKDLKVIYGRLHNLNPKWFPEGSRPLVYQEVIDLGDEPIKASEYYTLGLVTEFKYGAMLGSVFRKWNGYKLSDLRTWGEGWGLMPSDRALVFVDNHDNQRGHGAGGASILTFWEPRPYRAAVAFMLAHPYGMSRVMSSYRWDRHVVNGQDENDWVGPPINPDGSTKPVPINPDGSTKPVPINPDGSCGDRWVCEHRWPQIRSEIYLFYNNYLN